MNDQYYHIETANNLAAELATISASIHTIFNDPALRPHFAPAGMETAVLAYPTAGGKALRPALTFLTCRALGGNTAAALRIGAAIELYHTYTLVHDDIIDRDALRRGQPSVHTLMANHGAAEFSLTVQEAEHYGLSVAILTGDIQQAWSIDLLASLPDIGIDPLISLQLIRKLEGITGPAILAGEMRDIQLPYIPVAEVSSEDIMEVIRTKTAALFGYCAWAGALLAQGKEDEKVTALTNFADKAGTAFQLQDDVLGLIGNSTTLGKPVGNDLREGKRTQIIALGWQRASSAEKELLSAVLGNPEADEKTITTATELLSQLGAIAEVQRLAKIALQKALQHLNSLSESNDIQLLRELAVMMVNREK